MSQRRHAQVIRTVRISEPTPTTAQRQLYFHMRDMLIEIAQDTAFPGPWRQSCWEAWEIMTRDKRTVY